MNAMTINRYAISLWLAVMLLSGAGAEAACRVVMKNGYEFTAESCRKSGNRIEVEMEAGTIVLTPDEVLRFKQFDRNPDTKKEQQAPGGGAPGQQGPAAAVPPAVKGGPTEGSSSEQSEMRKTLQWRLNDLRSRIAPLDAEKRTAEMERQGILKRMDDLKKEGRQKAINNLQDPLVKWMEYLLPADRLWLSEVPPKLAELESKIASLESALKPLKDDERYLEQRLSELR